MQQKKGDCQYNSATSSQNCDGVLKWSGFGFVNPSAEIKLMLGLDNTVHEKSSETDGVLHTMMGSFTDVIVTGMEFL